MLKCEERGLALCVRISHSQVLAQQIVLVAYRLTAHVITQPKETRCVHRDCLTRRLDDSIEFQPQTN